MTDAVYEYTIVTISDVIIFDLCGFHIRRTVL